MSSFMLPHRRSRDRNRKESAPLLCATSAAEAVGRFARPEVADLRELCGLCGGGETGRTGSGQVLIPEAFLGELAKAHAEPRSPQITCKPAALWRSG